MLTVKQVQDDGAEELFEVTSCRYEPRGLGESTSRAIVWIEPVGGMRMGLPAGSVFVMNTAGKTIARYDLSSTDAGKMAKAPPLRGITGIGGSAGGIGSII